MSETDPDGGVIEDGTRENTFAPEKQAESTDIPKGEETENTKAPETSGAGEKKKSEPIELEEIEIPIS